MNIEKKLKRLISEATCELDSRDYVTAMRWLSEWAESQADATEFSLEELNENDDYPQV